MNSEIPRRWLILTNKLVYAHLKESKVNMLAKQQLKTTIFSAKMD